MTRMHGKIRTTSGRQVLRVTSAIEQYKDQLTEGLDASLAEDGWDVSAACVEHLQGALGRVLESRLEELRGAVDARRYVAQHGRRIRRHRDEASRKVYRLLVRLRRLVQAMGSAEAETAIFGSGKTPRDPKGVAAMASELQQRMQSDITRGDLSGRFGGTEVLDAWVAEVAEPLTKLYETLDQVSLLEVDETTAVQKVRRARRSMRRAQTNALKVLEGLYGLAEAEDLGQTLRIRGPERRKAEKTSSKPSAANEETLDGREPASPPTPSEDIHAKAPRDSREPVAATFEEQEATAETLNTRPSAPREVIRAVDLPETQSRPVASETGDLEAPAHPVRKVLQGRTEEGFHRYRYLEALQGRPQSYTFFRWPTRLPNRRGSSGVAIRVRKYRTIRRWAW